MVSKKKIANQLEDALYGRKPLSLDVYVEVLASHENAGALALKYVRRRSVRENPILSHAQHKLRIRCATGALNAPGGAVACMEHADPLVAQTSASGASKSVP